MCINFWVRWSSTLFDVELAFQPPVTYPYHSRPDWGLSSWAFLLAEIIIMYLHVSERHRYIENVSLKAWRYTCQPPPTEINANESLLASNAIGDWSFRNMAIPSTFLEAVPFWMPHRLPPSGSSSHLPHRHSRVKLLMKISPVTVPRLTFPLIPLDRSTIEYPPQA